MSENLSTLLLNYRKKIKILNTVYNLEVTFPSLYIAMSKLLSIICLRLHELKMSHLYVSK